MLVEYIVVSERLTADGVSRLGRVIMFVVTVGHYFVLIKMSLAERALIHNSWWLVEDLVAVKLKLGRSPVAAWASAARP